MKWRIVKKHDSCDIIDENNITRAFYLTEEDAKLIISAVELLQAFSGPIVSKTIIPPDSDLPTMSEG